MLRDYTLSLYSSKTTQQLSLQFQKHMLRHEETQIPKVLAEILTQKCIQDDALVDKPPII